MAFHRRKVSTDVPHIPFYKDERVIGKKITVSVSLRLFFLAVVVFVVTMGWAFFTVFEAESELNAYVRNGHSVRVQDQVRTDKKIDQLACYIIANIKDSAAPIVKKVRHQYSCAPYGKDPNFNLYPHQKPKAKATKSPAGHPAARPSASASAQQPSSSRRAVAVGGERPTAQAASTSRVASSPHGGGVAGRPAPQPAPSTTTSSAAPIIRLPVPLPNVGPVGGKTCAVHVAGTCLA